MAGLINIQPEAVSRAAARLQEQVQAYIKDAQTLGSIMQQLAPSYQSTACKAASANAAEALAVIKDQTGVISRQAAYAQKYAAQAVQADEQSTSSFRNI